MRAHAKIRIKRAKRTEYILRPWEGLWSAMAWFITYAQVYCSNQRND